jgi:hypothetical protein
MYEYNFMIRTLSAGCVVLVAERRGAYWIVVVRSNGRRPRWKDNMRMDLQEVG